MSSWATLSREFALMIFVSCCRKYICPTENQKMSQRNFIEPIRQNDFLGRIQTILYGIGTNDNDDIRIRTVVRYYACTRIIIGLFVVGRRFEYLTISQCFAINTIRMLRYGAQKDDYCRYAYFRAFCDDVDQPQTQQVCSTILCRLNTLWNL
jgi:hypothetical protein